MSKNHSKTVKEHRLHPNTQNKSKWIDPEHKSSKVIFSYYPDRGKILLKWEASIEKKANITYTQ